MIVRRSLFAGLALTLAAVMPPAVPGLAATVGVEPPAGQAAPHMVNADVGRTVALLRRSFQAIHDRTIQERGVPDLALAGVRGLVALDDALSLKISGQTLQIAARGVMVLGVALPRGEAAADWAETVAVVARDLRRYSPALAEMAAADVHTAILNAALEGFDVHTRYDPPVTADAQRSKRNGFSGVGIRYEREGNGIRILEVLRHGPSDGVLRADDLVTHVDGQMVADMDISDMSHHLRGPRHSLVVLTVIRAADPARTVMVRRDRVVPDSVVAEVRNGVALVRIRRFNIATSDSVRAALQEAEAAEGPLAGAVLDLRGNPGGLLDQAYGVADLFLDDGILVTTRGRHPASLQSYSATKGDILGGRPLAVLVDGRSASSAEILAAALKDSGRATLLGTNSYGKGTVQTIVRLPNDGELKLTWSRFHSPAGYAIQDLGVMPSVCLSGMGHDPAGEGVVSAAGGVAADTMGALVPQAIADRWRTVPFEAAEERLALRDTCRREARSGLDFDIDAALAFIRDAAGHTQHATLKPGAGR